MGVAKSRALTLLVASSLSAIIFSGEARAAGTAYNVDTSEVSDTCKIDAWTSLAGNRDLISAISPSCSLKLQRPVELSAQFARTRADGEWDSSVTPKIKVKLKDSAVGEFGLAITSNATFDMATGENTSFAVTVPATVRFSNTARLNLNAGWLQDKIIDRNFFTYGAGLDLRTADNVWIVTLEVFGIAGNNNELSNATLRPRAQAGLRWRPVEAWSADIIYGHNLTGENAHWITFATSYRFSLGN